MIPEISAILEMFKAGQCTMTQALGWIEQHMENIELRDHFAGLAMQPMCDGKWPSDADAPEIARRSYVIAAAMLKARSA